MSLSNSRNFYAPETCIKQYGCVKLVHFSGRLSSADTESLAFVSHCSANFQPILDCFMPNFKSKYEDLENIKAYRVNTVVSNLIQNKCWVLFFGTPGYSFFMFCYEFIS